MSYHLCESSYNQAWEKFKKLSLTIKYRWDLGCVCKNESGYVSDTSGGGRGGEWNEWVQITHTPSNNNQTRRRYKPEIINF